MPRFTPGALKDRRDVTLPGATNHSFWLEGSAWDFPDFENADTFVQRLARKGLIVRDFAVDATLRNGSDTFPIRSMQRHFLRAVGITHRTVRQIERARYATTLLRQGVPILDTVHDAGYFDQAHLTRSVKALIGQTPVEIARGDATTVVSIQNSAAPDFYDARGRFTHECIGTTGRAG